MADPAPNDPNTPTPPATPGTPENPEPEPSPAEQSVINQKFAADIARAEDIARTALKGAYAGALAQNGMPASFPTRILKNAAKARAALTRALAADAEKRGDTDSLKTLRKRLVGLIQQAQSLARSVFFFSNPARLKVYHVGDNLYENLPTLKQFSLDVRAAAIEDRLAGITTEYLAEFKATWEAIYGPEPTDAEPAPAPDAEPEPDTEAVGERASHEVQVKKLTRDGMRILFVADGTWPHWREGSAGPRHAFGLPADRPYAPAQPDEPVEGENPSMG